MSYNNNPNNQHNNEQQDPVMDLSNVLGENSSLPGAPSSSSINNPNSTISKNSPDLHTGSNKNVSSPHASAFVPITSHQNDPTIEDEMNDGEDESLKMRQFVDHLHKLVDGGDVDAITKLIKKVPPKSTGKFPFVSAETHSRLLGYHEEYVSHPELRMWCLLIIATLGIGTFLLFFFG